MSPATAGGAAIQPSTSPFRDFESVPCAICGNGEYTVVIPARRDPAEPVDLERVFRSSGDEPLQDQAVRCRACGLVYVSPRLRWELILKGYEGATDPQFVSQAAFRERTFARCLDRVESAVALPGKRVVDVGAAGGSFLAEARKRGYEVSGCEPSSWMRRFAREHYGIELAPGTIFELPLPEETVDLLTLWDVLEHTPDPKRVLEKAHRLLRSKGVLALSYPDFGSMAARLLGSRWPFLLTIHLFYFTPRTMKDLLRRTGFEPLIFRSHIQTLELGYVAERAKPYVGPLGGALTKSVGLLRLDRLPFHYWVGQTMAVARKQ